MKKIIAMTLTAALAAGAAAMPVMADNEPIKIIVNDVELVIPEGDTTPFIENDRTLVPMRAIFEALGAKVNWDGETKTIVSYDPVSDVSITMQIDSANMFVGEESVELDVPAKIVNDRTVVPIRAIAEGMNSEVKWDGETRTVIVKKDVAKDAGEGGTQDPGSEVENPWTTYATLDELNAAIGEAADVVFTFEIPDEEALVVNEDGFRYLATENMAELQGRWEIGSGADVTIRIASGEMADISGIVNTEKGEEITLEDGPKATLYKYEDNYYVVWTSEFAGEKFSYSVAVESADNDMTAVAELLANDLETIYSLD